MQQLRILPAHFKHSCFLCFILCLSIHKTFLVWQLLQDSFRSNDSYQDDEENPARSTGESELPRSNSSSNASPALQKHSESFQPLETMIASSLGATSATVNKEQEEKDKGAHDTDNEKEVKSILTKDRKPANDGYKAVWFNPDAKEEVMVIEDAPEEEEDGNDRDRNEGKENRDDDDNDDSNNQDSHPGDPVVSFIPLRANYGTPDQDTTTGGEGENILLQAWQSLSCPSEGHELF